MKNASAIVCLLVGMLIGVLLMSFRPAPIIVPLHASSLEPIEQRAKPSTDVSVTSTPQECLPEPSVVHPVQPPENATAFATASLVPVTPANPPHSPAVEIKVTALEPKEAELPVDDPRVLKLQGRVAANLDVDVKCKVSGQILRLPVEVGDIVEKGQVLAEVDNSDEERGVMRAQLSVKSSQTRLEQSRQSLEIAEQSLVISKARVAAAMRSQEVKAKRTTDRVSRLKDPVKKQYISQEEFDDAQAEAVIAQALLDSTRAQHDDLKTQAMALALKRHDIQLAETQLEMDRLTLTNTQQRMTDTRVLAPMKGVVTSRYVQAGSVIISGTSTQGTRILTISDVSQMNVNVPVDANQIGKIKEGMTAEVRCESFPDTVILGKVARIAPRGMLIQKQGHLRSQNRNRRRQESIIETRNACERDPRCLRQLITS
jgi:multidrug resistance efflux pump